HPVPVRGGAGTGEHRTERDDSGEFELRAADAPRLVDAEELRLVEVAQRLLGDPAQLLAARRAAAQLRQQRLGARPELSVPIGTSQGSRLRWRATRPAAERCT